MRKLSMAELNRKTVEQFRNSEKIPITIILENIRSMHNVGSVFRTADAFLVERLYLCGFTPQPPHRDIQKTALGSTETIEWKYFKNTREAILEVKEEGYRIFAVEQAENSLQLHQASFQIDEKVALIFGNEVEGVSDGVLRLCEGCIEIPQFGMKHSLNISVAAGIVLWELVRKRVISQIVR